MRNTPLPHQNAVTETLLWKSNIDYLMVVEPPAAKKLFRVVGWRRDDFPDNRKEMGGILIGYYIKNENEEKRVQAVVLDILVANTECRYSGYVEWDALEDIRLQRVFFEIKEKIEAKYIWLKDRVCIIGWWHTHPNGLPVWMSETDLKTQREKFYKPEKYSIVINPHRGIIRAFAGKDAIEVPFIILTGKDKGIAIDETLNTDKKKKHKKSRGKKWKKKTRYAKKIRK